MPSDPFGDQLESWRAWQQAPWGRLRYAVVHEVLTRSLDAHHASPGANGPASVLDVGGGDGGDALPLAEAGHHVIVVDPSATLLRELRAGAAARGLGDRVRGVRGGLDDLHELGLARADLVLCHTVLQYRQDLRADVARLARLVAPGGLVSLVAPNPPADLVTAAVRDRDLTGALSLLEATSTRAATFDHAARRLVRGDAEAALVDAGLEPVAHHGIRCVTDVIPDDGRKHDPGYYADLLRLELALHDRDPYRDLARLWQVIARRPDA